MVQSTQPEFQPKPFYAIVVISEMLHVHFSKLFYRYGPNSLSKPRFKKNSIRHF